MQPLVNRTIYLCKVVDIYKIIDIMIALINDNGKLNEHIRFGVQIRHKDRF